MHGRLLHESYSPYVRCAPRDRAIIFQLNPSFFHFLLLLFAGMKIQLQALSRALTATKIIRMNIVRAAVFISGSYVRSIATSSFIFSALPICSHCFSHRSIRHLNGNYWLHSRYWSYILESILITFSAIFILLF